MGGSVAITTTCLIFISGSEGEAGSSFCEPRPQETAVHHQTWIAEVCRLAGMDLCAGGRLGGRFMSCGSLIWNAGRAPSNTLQTPADEWLYRPSQLL